MSHKTKKKGSWWKLTTFATIFSIAIALAGCGDDTTNVFNIGLTLPGSFPGNQVRASFLAPDGAAMSHAGSNVVGDQVNYWSHSQNKNAILTWSQDGRLYATYMTNGTFTPPVPIRGAHTQGSNPSSERVIWLNTSSHSDGTARGRNGDAIIIFKQFEQDDPADSNSNQTIRLWSSYFDASRAGVSSEEVSDSVSGNTVTFQWGFMKNAQTVDNDPDDSDSSNISANVSQSGLISDSHSGSYEEGGNAIERPSYSEDGGSSGDATNYAWALWTQDPDAGASTTNTQYLAKQFDLTSAGFSFPTGSPTTLQTPTGFDNGEVVGFDWIGHNGSVFLNWGNNGSDDNDDEITAYHQFSATGITSPVVVNNFDDGDGAGNNTVDVDYSARNLYGADHGLNFTIIIYGEDDFDGDTSQTEGNKSEDQDIYVATFDPSNGTQLGSSTEIDEFTTEAATPQFANANEFSTRISRDGSYIAVLYHQLNTNDGSATNDNEVVKVRVYDTSRDLSASTTPLSSTLVLTANAGNANEANVSDPIFQVELANGQYSNIRCAIQSDVTVMNVIFEQRSTTGADPNDELHLAGFKVTLDTTTPAAPTLAADTSDTIVAAQDSGWGNINTGDDALAYDHGTDGKANVVLVGQANQSQQDPGSGNFTEQRVFHFTAGGSTINLDNTTNLISTDGAFDSRQFAGELRVITTARATSAGNWSGSFAHIFFEQHDDSNDDQLMHIAWQKKLATPALGTLTQISHDIGDDVSDTDHDELLIGVLGQNVAIFWSYIDEHHLYYNEWNPSTGWKSTPDLVDNHYFDIQLPSDDDVEVFLDRDGTATSCDDLSQTIAVFNKQLDDESGDERLLFRVRD